MNSRLQKLLGPTGPQGSGLEIGALDSPLLRKPEHDVLYVDYATTEVVRANQFDPAVRLEQIVEVDIVWGSARLAEAVGRPVDYVLASHVIEHVPDLIGWLLEVAEVLRPEGVLGLAIPDKRFTFDALRQVSVLSEAVEAHLLGAKRPSLRQVYDVASLGIGVDAAEVWGNRFDPAARRDEVLARLRPALNLVTSLHASPQYRDAHCWVFTPRTFLTVAEELATLALFPFRISAFYPTETGDAEFLVRLVRADPNDPAIRADLRAARSELSPEQPSDSSAAATIEILSRRLAAIEGSRSWKATAPLRALRRWFSR